MPPLGIARGVWQIGGYGLSDDADCSVYLVDGGGELAVIDAGVGRSVPVLLANIEELGFHRSQVRLIVATHGHIDHTGGLAGLKAETGAVVAAHALELPAIQEGRPALTGAAYYGVNYEPVTVDLVFRQGEETTRVGTQELMVLHTPGHTPGSIVVLAECGGEKVLFGQDVHGPFDPAWRSDLHAWRRSMRLLLELEPDVLCEGHFGIFRPKEKVRRYIERCVAANGGW